MTGAESHIVCSVVLPALQDGPAVQQTLIALDSQRCDLAHEVIVVSPVRVDVSACATARLVRCDALGPAAALNAGIAAAKGAVLALTDIDCLPAEDWLAAGLACVGAHGGIVAGRIEQTPANAAAPSVVEEFEMRWSLRQDHDARRGVASASNLFVHRDVFERAGTFREDMPSKSDWEFCERARLDCFSLTYCDAATVRHRVIASWSALWRSKVRLADGMARFYSVRGEGKAAARREALRQLRPPLRSLRDIVASASPATRKLALVGALGVSRVAYLAGWLVTEVRPR